MDALGIDGKFLLGQIVNFLILFGALSFFLYKPLLKMLNDRRQAIADSLSNAKKIEQNLAQSDAATREALDKAQREARAILDEATKLATDQKKKIIDEAQIQSDRIIDSAKSEAKQMKDDIVKDAKKELSAVVLATLDKIVGQGLTDEQKKNLSDKAIREI